MFLSMFLSNSLSFHTLHTQTSTNFFNLDAIQNEQETQTTKNHPHNEDDTAITTTTDALPLELSLKKNESTTTTTQQSSSSPTMNEVMTGNSRNDEQQQQQQQPDDDGWNEEETEMDVLSEQEELDNEDAKEKVADDRSTTDGTTTVAQQQPPNPQPSSQDDENKMEESCRPTSLEGKEQEETTAGLSESVVKTEEVEIAPRITTSSSTIADNHIPQPKKLLILSSSLSLNKTAMKRQEQVFLVLDNNNATAAKDADKQQAVQKTRTIPYDVVDATDEQQESKRDHLLQLSQSRDYPQFFLVDTSNELNIEYWGNYDRFVLSNDRRTLARELTGNWTTEDEEREEAKLKEQLQQLNHESLNTAIPPRKSPSRGTDHYYEQLDKMEAKYKSQIAELTAQLQAAKELSNNHESCVLERKQLQASMMQEMNDKEEQLNEVMRSNEGYKLKIDMLQREVDGTKKLLAARDSDMGKASALHGTVLTELEEKVKVAEEKASKYNFEHQRAKETIERLKTELGTARNEHEGLKSRAKDVALELKERRGECRELKSKIEKFDEEREGFERQIEELKAQLSHQNRSRGERDSEVEKLQTTVGALQADLQKAKEAIDRKDAEAEKSLADYKKKAQNSLAMANSRTAAAVQAREEAELEARAARNTADTAMDRAVQAETESRRIVAESKARVAELEQKTSAAVESEQMAKAEIVKLQNQLENLKQDLVASSRSRTELSEEVGELRGNLLARESSLSEFEEKAATSSKKIADLERIIVTLRDQLSTAEQKASSMNARAQEDASREDRAKLLEKDSEIHSLREDLKSSNDAVAELKEALKNAVENQSIASTDIESYASESSSVPLFYAMEKQAELKTARNEINRLANMLADAQSDRSAALEMLEDMKREVEELQAKLRRYEKLSGATREGEKDQKGSGAVNIEYLKNIMLSYLNAKTIAEKKSLVPVIGAVLELTHEEQNSAIKTIDDSVSIGGVGSSIFESFSSTLTKR